MHSLRCPARPASRFESPVPRGVGRVRGGHIGVGTGLYCVVPRIAMVQATDSPTGHDSCPNRGAGPDAAPTRGVLPQGDVGSVPRVVFEEFAQQASQMLLVQHDHVIEQLPTHRTNPALGYSVLPRAAKRGSLGFHAHRAEGVDHAAGEDRVAIEDQEPGSAVASCAGSLEPPSRPMPSSPWIPSPLGAWNPLLDHRPICPNSANGLQSRRSWTIG